MIAARVAWERQARDAQAAADQAAANQARHAETQRKEEEQRRHTREATRAAEEAAAQAAAAAAAAAQRAQDARAQPGPATQPQFPVPTVPDLGGQQPLSADDYCSSWEAIDFISVEDCIVNPCMMLEDVPPQHTSAYAKVFVDIFD